jgi:signal transduction histidine kinase
MLTWGGLGLPYSLFSWLLDPRQLRWVLICYAWEVPVAGGLGPVLFPLLWFRRIEQRWDQVFREPAAVDPHGAAALERAILDFPMRVGMVVLVTSLAGYGVGALQVRLFAGLPTTEVVKVLALGVATGLIGGLFVFLYLESLLAPLLERFGRLGTAVPRAGRRVPLYAKVFACSLVMTLTALILLGTSLYSRGERVLEEQVGQRILAEARRLADGLAEGGVPREAEWRAAAHAMDLGPSGRALLVDAGGSVLAGGPAGAHLHDEGFGPSVEQAVLAGTPGYHVDRVGRQRLVASVAPDAGRRVVAIAERREFEEELAGMLRRGLVLFVASLLLALVQGLLFSRRLTRPIEEVTGRAVGIAHRPGGPWETVPVRTNDEVGELATAFNHMIARLEQARAELERRVAEATRNITTLYEVTRTTSSTLELEAVLGLIAEKTLATLALGRLVVLWRPPDLGDVVDAYTAADGAGERFEVDPPIDLDTLCSGSQPAVGLLDSRVPPAVAGRLGTRRALWLPLRFKDQLLGVVLGGLEADAPEPDLELAGALASQAAAALANAALFETVRRTEAELRKLSQMRAQLQEESLRAMSRELHDGLAQVLTVINMDLGVLERAELDPTTLRARLHEAREQLTGLLQEVRTMSQVLRPSMLDFGLVPTLQWFVEKFAGRTDIEVALRTPPEETRLPGPIELMLYRVVQEALTNVAKHAHARHVAVELAVRDGHAVLSVTDDGVGFEVGRFRRTPALLGVGLLGMRERVAYYRGSLDIRSRPQAGVRITVTVPLDVPAGNGSGHV